MLAASQPLGEVEVAPERHPDRLVLALVLELVLGVGYSAVEVDVVRRTAPRRMRGQNYPSLEAHTSRKDNATPPSGLGVGTIGHQPSPGKLRPLTINLKNGTYLITRYRSRPSVRPVPVRRIYEKKPVRHTAPRRMRGPSYPTLEAPTSRQSNTPLRPRRWDYRSPAVARKVASPHQEPKNWHLSCNTV